MHYGHHVPTSTIPEAISSKLAVPQEATGADAAKQRNAPGFSPDWSDERIQKFGRRSELREYPQSPPNFPQNSVLAYVSLVFTTPGGYKPFGC